MGADRNANVKNRGIPNERKEEIAWYGVELKGKEG